MVNGDDAEPVLQNVLLWTFARLFDWVITLLHDAVADDDDDGYSDPYWRHLRYNASFMDSRFYTHPWPKDLGIIKIITKLTNNLHWLS